MPANAQVLEMSQAAPQYLRKQTTGFQNASLFSGLLNGESLDTWSRHEQVLLSCLQTGDDNSALISLERLINRFGAENERIAALRGLYQEAVAKNDAALREVLQEYESISRTNPTNLPIQKRRITLLGNLSRYSEAIAALVDLLEVSPNDIEAWSELSDLYLSQGLYTQATFCLEEVLLIIPNAWNVHARIGEVLLMSVQATVSEVDSTALLSLFEATRRYCRSIELCHDYIRGLVGLKIATERILQLPSDKLDRLRSQNSPSLSIIRSLNGKAVTGLQAILESRAQPTATIGEQALAELVAARETLAVT